MRAVIISFIVFALLLTQLKIQIPTASAENTQPVEVLAAPQPIHTTSRFETKLETITKKIERETQIKDDPQRELDDDAVVDEGADGLLTQVIKTSYYEGQEYSKEIVSEEVTPQKPRIISHGTKIVLRSLDTPSGPITYWRKLHVYATDYDSHCLGCDETTATGLKQGKGVIAVDPSVIKLGSRVYVPGYGLAIAGDTGGSIKGKIIDLGFDDARLSGWASHFVDIYLLQ